MNKKIISKSLNFEKKIIIPSSKSYLNRLLIIGSIKKEEFTIFNTSQSTDVLNMIKCLRSIGLVITEHENSLIIKNSFPLCEEQNNGTIKIYSGDGGTTTRFLMSLLSLGKNKYNLISSGHMKDRPMQDLIESLISIGVNIKIKEDKSFLISGPKSFKKKEIRINCLKSSQFASSLHLSFPSFTISTINNQSSKKYINLTLDLISKTKTQNHFDAPADFSSMSYPIALALLLGKLTVNNFNKIDNYQTDSKLIPILIEMGADISINSKKLIIKKSKLNTGFNADANIFPDLIPTLIFLASSLDHNSYFYNLKILEEKESNRLKEMIKLLEAFNINFAIDNYSLTIMPKENKVIKNVDLNLPHDHRIIMIASMYRKVLSTGEIDNILDVNKSYPTFFKDLMDV